MKTTKLLIVFTFIFLTKSFAAPRYIYQLTIYHLQSQEQETRVEHYLQHAFVPALHRANIRTVGVFKPIATEKKDAERLLYVFIPYTTFDQYLGLEEQLMNDKTYQKAGSDYIHAAYDNPPYTRMETIFMRAFEKSPTVSIPQLKGNRKDRIYELRSYEGPTEKRYRNKVDMFNLGDEINLFKRLGFNAVFYGEVLAGKNMPNLMYLTTFEDMQSREKHWDAFNNDPYWKKLSSSPNYQHNVSHSDIIFLYPTDYSDF
ncbi:hypothetical protein GCM10023231_40510 [Olivibacter ginsenosidimutans]|uniref:NIPSNAP domain-containing protein n=1 Tax=Olivibacter ginsenosidimutans TaxID=1176537 RepID=A0ABP9CAE4_9SPHI